MPPLAPENRVVAFLARLPIGPPLNYFLGIIGH
jgi:hypothetical protein